MDKHKVILQGYMTVGEIARNMTAWSVSHGMPGKTF